MLKDYFEYRRKKKEAKKALANMVSEVTPVLCSVGDNIASTGKVIVRLTEALKGYKKDALVELAIKEVADILKTSETRLVEMLQYIATLSPEEIQKLFVHSAVETNVELSALDSDTEVQADA